MSERAALTRTPENKGKGPVSAKPKENFYESMDSPVEQIFHLQRTIGNQAVQRLLKSGTIQAKLTIGKPNDKYEQEADRVADKVMSMPEPKGSLVNGHSSLVQRQIGPEEEEKEPIQTKPLAEQITPLVQRQVGPEEEEEPVQTKLLQRQAEPEEEEVQPKLQRQPEEEEEEPIQTKLLQRQEAEEEEEPVQTKRIQRQEAEEEEEPVQTKLQRQPEDEEEEPIQRQPQEEEEGEPIQTKPAHSQTPAVTSNIESSVNSLKGGGQPLSESTRSYFEPRFGADFSQVRVHTDSKADNASKSVNAKAFTTGQDVVFGAGQYSPGTSIGRGLLAHELIHVLQQEKSVNRILRRKNDQPNNKTDEKEQDDSLTLPEANTTGTKPEAEVDWLTEEVAIKTGKTPDEACEWLKKVAFRTGMAPDAAWGWLEYVVALAIDRAPYEAWKWLESVASQTGMAPDAAWDWLDNVALEIDRAPRATWHRIEYVVLRTGMAPDAAWDWIKYVAFQYSMPPVEAWDWIEELGFRTSMPPDAALGWLEYVVAPTIERTPDVAWEWLKEVSVKIKMEPEDTWDWLNKVADKIEKKPKELLKLIEDVKSLKPFTIAHKFEAQEELEARRSEWYLALLIMEITNEDELIKWLVGQKELTESKEEKCDYSQKVFNEAIKESRTQMEGLLAALKDWADKLEEPINLPIEEVKENEKEVKKVKILGGWKKYGYRSADDQYKIWLEKYYFIRRNFDRITIEASNKCKGDSKVKTEYNTRKMVFNEEYKEKINREFSSLKTIFTPGLMWNPIGTKKFEERLKSLGITKKVGPVELRNIREIHYKCWLLLTPEQRQQEILEASSAPGISRHHWGTDVDILSVEPEDWEKGGQYYGVYKWLKDNAWRYGFMQPYVKESNKESKENPKKESEGDMDRYMEERWHWSYYPVSSVLLQIAKDKKNTLDKKLGDMWKEYNKEVEKIMSEVKGDKKKEWEKKTKEIKGYPFEFLQKEEELPEDKKKWKWMDYVFNVEKEPWWGKQGQGAGKK